MPYQDELDQDQQQQQQDLQNVEQPKDGGLTPEQEFVLVQLSSLDDRNDELLAQILQNYPDLRSQILEYANAHFGNTMVAKAMARVDGTFEQEQLDLMAQQEADRAFMEQQIAEETERQKTTEIADQQQTELAPQEQATPAPEQVEQLEAVETMKPGDEEMLAAALAAAPEIRDQVVEAATEQVGQETVEQAIEVQAEEQTAAPADAQVTAEPVAEPVVEQVKDQPKDEVQEEEWVIKAREYNERHPRTVDEFISLAGEELRLPDGSVDPTVIVAWQKENGVSVDGRIGAATLAAARAGAKKVSVVEAVMQPQEEQPPADAQQ